MRRELLKIWKEDQDSRTEWNDIFQKYGEGSPKVDSIINVVRVLDSILLPIITRNLNEKGWVGKDKVGQLGNNTLFLIIQHADLKTQQKYQSMMRSAVKEGKTQAYWLALMEDRVALGEGKKQRYGSQLYWDKIAKRNYVAPLEDPDNVDSRRKSVGLEPMADYLKQWELTWDVEEYKKQLLKFEKLNTNKSNP